MRLVLVSVAALLLCGCALPFTKVDFKYTSVAHLSVREAMTTLDVAPEDLVVELSDAFRQRGATVLERKKVDYYLSIPAKSQQCWEASAAIAQQEFAAYRANNFRTYHDIDRTAPFASRGVAENCRLLDEVRSDKVESRLLMVQFPPRSAQTIVYRPTLSSFFATGQGTSVQGFATSQTREDVKFEVSTRLYIWAWQVGGQRTQVYLEARPLSGQVEAAPGHSVGWTWWQVTNANEERDVVKSYVLLLEDYDRARSKR